MRRTIELIAFFAALLLAAMALHAWLAAHDEQQRLAATLATQEQLLDAADARERTRDAALNDTLAAIAKLKATALTPAQIVAALPNYLPLPQPITLETPAALKGSRGANSPISSAVSPQGTASVEPSPTSQTGASQSTEDGKNRAAQKGTAAPGKFTAGTAPEDAPTAAPSAGSSPTSPAPPTFVASPDLPSAPAAKIPAADLQPLFDYVQDCRACQARLAVAQQNAADDAAKITALDTERDAAITASKGGTFWRRLRRNALWFAIGAGTGIAIAKR
jgi:hypothetical protein